MKFSWEKYRHKILIIDYEKSFVSSLVLSILISLGVFILNVFHPEILSLFSFSVESLMKITELILPTYAGIFGITIAVLSLVISIIQISNNRLSLLELVFKTCHINFIFNFGLINIILLTCTYLYIKSNLFIVSYYLQSIIYSTSISLPIFCILLIYAFYKIFSFTKEEYVIKMYLSDVGKLINLEKQIQVKLNLSQILNTKSNELDNEMKRCIQTNNTLISDNILNFYIENLKLNSSSKIHNLLNYKLIIWVYLSFENNSNQLLNFFISFWNRAILLNDDHFVNFSSMLFSHSVAKENIKFGIFVVNVFPNRLKNAILSIVENSASDNKEIYVRLDAKPLLMDFAELVHQISQEQNLKLLKRAIHEINLSEEYFYNEYRPSFKELDQGEVNNFRLRLFNLKFSNLSWLYYKCFNNKIVTPETLSVIELIEESIKIRKYDFLDYATSILKNRDFYKIEEWIWQSEERLNATSYFVDSEEDVIGVGILVWVIKMNFLLEDFGDFAGESQNVLIFNCKSKFEKLKDNRSIWHSLLSTRNSKIKIYSEDDINLLLSKLNDKVEKKRVEDIVNEPISDQKVNDFKRQVELDWNNNNALEKVFDFYKTPQLILNKEEFFLDNDIKPRLVNFQRGKILFLQENYQDIYGIEIGLNLCIEANNLFKNLVKSQINYEQKTSLLEVLSDISELNKKGLEIKTVLLSNSVWYSNESEILNSGNFVSQNEFPRALNFETFGVFDNEIQIIPLSYTEQESIIIALNCSDAISLYRYKEKNWINETLKVEVQEINDEVLVNKMGIDLSGIKLEELDILKTGVLLEVGMYLRFSIQDVSKIKSYLIS